MCPSLVSWVEIRQEKTYHIFTEILIAFSCANPAEKEDNGFIIPNSKQLSDVILELCLMVKRKAIWVILAIV